MFPATKIGEEPRKSDHRDSRDECLERRFKFYGQTFLTL
jgi:hypothetical protein